MLVEESMENILTVVDERNETYNVLEKGVTGKPGGAYVRNALGMMYYRKFKEHLIPKHLNEKYNLTHSKYEKWMSKYLTLYYEKKRKQSFAKKKASERLRRRIKAKYPHLTTKEINTAVREEMKKPY
ncbi:hypothetical protein KUTeg_001349 [Tegillarca granosa]|uniref:Uncharacterized protein n=1 Tax=Tegillarca granosa TaxID=220873 RepID=A0ABQ9FR49_TEGGR|nr:hypothetical protein KUTeg_001349 [Tegillarca granosa]